MLHLTWLQMYFIVKVQGLLLDKGLHINTEKDRQVKGQLKWLSCDFFLVGGKTTMIIDDDLFFLLKSDKVRKDNQRISLHAVL